MSIQETGGVRQMVSNRPVLVTGVMILAIGAAAWYGWSQTGRQDSGTSYATIDDGNTTFKTSPENIPPFMSGGKEAVQAIMLSCDGGGTKFVGYLTRYAEKDKPVMVRAMKGAKGIMLPSPEVKKPGDAEWVVPPERIAKSAAAVADSAKEAQKYAKIRQVKCPDGSTALQYD